MTIWKYPIGIIEYQTIVAPQGAKLIHVGLDGIGYPCVWAEVEPENPKAGIELYVVGTGHKKPEDATKHIGSFTQWKYMWHVYQRTP